MGALYFAAITVVDPWIRTAFSSYPSQSVGGNGIHPFPLPTPQDVGSLLAGMAMQGGQPFFSVWYFLLNGGMDKVLSRYPGGGGAAYSLGRALRGMLGLVLDEPMVGECARPTGAGQGGGGRTFEAGVQPWCWNRERLRHEGRRVLFGQYRAWGRYRVGAVPGSTEHGCFPAGNCFIFCGAGN